MRARMYQWHRANRRTPIAPRRACYLVGLLGATVLISMLGSRDALAQHKSVHAEGTVASGVTDNAANAPDETSEASAFTQVQPAVLVTYERPRSVHVSTLSVGANRYWQTDTAPNTFNYSLSHQSLFGLSPTAELGLTLSANGGNISSALGQAGGAAQDATLTGASRFYGGTIGQAYRWQFARDWRLTQGLSTTTVITTQEAMDDTAEDSDTFGETYTLLAAVDRSWTRAAAGVTSSLAYIGTRQEANDVTTLQLTPNVAATGRYDIAPEWSGSAQLGLAALITFDATDEAQEGTTFPILTGGFAINYFRPFGTSTANVALTVNRSITPNLLLATTTTATSAALTGGIPLPWFHRGDVMTVRVDSTIGYIFSQAAADTGADGGTWGVVTGDVAMTWLPEDAWTVSLRYQFLDQHVIEEAMLDPMAGGVVPQEFTRNMVLLQVSGRFPTRPAATIPNRSTIRVDRSNEDLLGEEQIVGGRSRAPRGTDGRTRGQ